MCGGWRGGVAIAHYLLLLEPECRMASNKLPPRRVQVCELLAKNARKQVRQMFRNATPSNRVRPLASMAWQGRDRRLPLLYSPAARFLEHRV